MYMLRKGLINTDINEGSLEEVQDEAQEVYPLLGGLDHYFPLSPCQFDCEVAESTLPVEVAPLFPLVSAAGHDGGYFRHACQTGELPIWYYDHLLYVVLHAIPVCFEEADEGGGQPEVVGLTAHCDVHVRHAV